jgi:hypothetical protein
MTRGELDFAGALRNRVVRLYGEAPAVAEARRWLTAEH